MIKEENSSLLRTYHTFHWDRAASYWDLLGPPLRPSEEDIRIMQQVVHKWSKTLPDRSLKAMLWGVTPEIAKMAWPEGTYLLAVDSSSEMIRLVWPGDVDGHRKVERGNWLELPVVDKSFDVIIGDGCFSCIDYPDGYRLLAQSAHRVVKNEGVLIMRFFVRPEESEKLEDVFRDLTAGRIQTFDGFKLRLLMAVQGQRSSVKLDDVWQVWKAAEIDIDSLISLTGWRKEVIQTIVGYQGKEARDAFPTLREVRVTLSKWFEETAIYVSDYQLGDRCPILVFRPS